MSDKGKKKSISVSWSPKCRPQVYRFVHNCRTGEKKPENVLIKELKSGNLVFFSLLSNDPKLINWSSKYLPVNLVVENY